MIFVSIHAFANNDPSWPWIVLSTWLMIANLIFIIINDKRKSLYQETLVELYECKTELKITKELIEKIK